MVTGVTIVFSGTFLCAYLKTCSSHVAVQGSVHLLILRLEILLYFRFKQVKTIFILQ